MIGAATANFLRGMGSRAWHVEANDHAIVGALGADDMLRFARVSRSIRRRLSGGSRRGGERCLAHRQGVRGWSRHIHGSPCPPTACRTSAVRHAADDVNCGGFHAASMSLAITGSPDLEQHESPIASHCSHSAGMHPTDEGGVRPDRHAVESDMEDSRTGGKRSDGR